MKKEKDYIFRDSDAYEIVGTSLGIFFCDSTNQLSVHVLFGTFDTGYSEMYQIRERINLDFIKSQLSVMPTARKAAGILQ